jgi:PhnO protein
MKVLYQNNISNTNNTYLLAVDGDNIIGYLSCHIQTLLHHGGNVAEIQEMFVTPRYRSSGVGKLLMSEVKRIAQQKGAIQLEVTTRVVRAEAIRFYVRESFQDTHKKLVYYF